MVTHEQVDKAWEMYKKEWLKYNKAWERRNKAWLSWVRAVDRRNRAGSMEKLASEGERKAWLHAKELEREFDLDEDT